MFLLRVSKILNLVIHPQAQNSSKKRQVVTNLLLMKTMASLSAEPLLALLGHIVLSQDGATRRIFKNRTHQQACLNHLGLTLIDLRDFEVGTSGVKINPVLRVRLMHIIRTKHFHLAIIRCLNKTPKFIPSHRVLWEEVIPRMIITQPLPIHLHIRLLMPGLVGLLNHLPIFIEWVGLW